MMMDNDFPYLGDSRLRDLLYRGEEREYATLPLPNRGNDPFRPYGEDATLPLPNKGGIPKAFESSDFLREYIAGSPSFDLNPDPDIDSPIIDQDIKEYRDRYGSSKIDMKKLEQRSRQIRNMIRGV